MKSFFKKVLVFGLLIFSMTGLFQLSFEIFWWQGAHAQKASWILKALSGVHFEKFDPGVLQPDHLIKPLEGLEKVRTLELLKVDVNHASLEELIGLPRIGPTIAQRIVQMRDHSGPFSGLEDLGNVKGLGPKSLNILKNWVRFGEESRKS